jgi:hypothetical protein
MSLTRQMLEATLRKYWPKYKENIFMPNSSIQMWNGSYWIKVMQKYYNQPSLTRLEGEVREELKENVTELIKVGVSRNTCRFCTSLGRYLCHCPLDKQAQPIRYTMGVDTAGLSSLGCLPHGTVINTAPQYVRWPHNHYGSPSDKVKLDDIVDHCLLEPIIEIEASL